jgi:hypothetical protein
VRKQRNKQLSFLVSPKEKLGLTHFMGSAALASVAIASMRRGFIDRKLTTSALILQARSSTGTNQPYIYFTAVGPMGLVMQSTVVHKASASATDGYSCKLGTWSFSISNGCIANCDVLSCNHPLKRSTRFLHLRQRHLSSPYRWARGLVVGRDGVVDVDKNACVTRFVRSGEADQRARATTSTVLDVDLRAGKVELSTTRASGTVKRNMLNAEQVLARGNRLWQGNADLLLAWCLRLVIADTKEQLCKVRYVPMDAHEMEPEVTTAGSSEICVCQHSSTLNLGYASHTLNHTFPLPSQFAAVLPAGTLAM